MPNIPVLSDGTLMIRQSIGSFCFAWLGLVVAGCASMHCMPQERSANDGPKTLLQWAVGPEEKDKNGDDEKKNGNGKNGDDKNGNGKNGKDKNGDEPNGNGYGKEPERDTITTDRPDFTEASTNVGKGRIQLESGYTFIRDRSNGSQVTSHSYPEVLLRIGMFADWFEFRIGQNFANESDSTAPSAINGGQDLYLGFRLALTEAKGVFPESALIVQTTVPTGHRDFTASEMLPGLNYLYSWEV